MADTMAATSVVSAATVALHRLSLRFKSVGPMESIGGVCLFIAIVAMQETQYAEDYLYMWAILAAMLMPACYLMTTL